MAGIMVPATDVLKHELYKERVLIRLIRHKRLPIIATHTGNTDKLYESP